MLIEFCERNVNRATRAMLFDLADRPGITIRPRGCMCRCSQCFDTPFLRVQGRDIEGPTHRSIIEEYLELDPCCPTAHLPVDAP